MSNKALYKIVFVSQGKIYEIYARDVAQADIYGFVMVENLVFGETSTLLVDPAEERLKSEFAGVQRSFIPLHAIIRIDQVEKRGTAKIINIDSKPAGASTTFPAEMLAGIKPEIPT